MIVFTDKLVRLSSEESNQLMKGMTKVVLSNDQDTVANRLDAHKRKPRLVTTMPSAAMMPKLTTADIKRRLAHIKFPLVILGKDQISSTMEVLDYDPPQFNGLDEHVWPFMVEWTEKQHHPKGKSNLSQNRRNIWPERNTNNLRKVNNEIVLNKPFKDKKNINVENNSARKKVEPKRLLQQAECGVLPQEAKKPRPLRQFKDKMLKLLFKKPSDQLLNEANGKTNKPTAPKDLAIVPETKSNERKQIDASTETYGHVETAHKDLLYSKKSSPMPVLNKRKIRSPFVGDKQANKHPWARAKWASDFIENVIKKIRDGAYYSQEEESYISTDNGKNNNRNKFDISFIDNVINKLKNGTYVGKNGLYLNFCCFTNFEFIECRVT